MYKLLRLKFQFNTDRPNNLLIRLPAGHRILSFGPDNNKAYAKFITDRAYVDVMLDTDTPNDKWSDRRFIVLSVGSEDINETLVHYRQLLGSFIAPGGKQCYVFEGGVVGV